jgi:hypothetical protein
MSRRSRRNRQRGAVVKASRPMNTSGGTIAMTAQDIATIVAGAHAGQAGTLTAQPMPRPPEWASRPFPPGTPLYPQAINKPRQDTGRPEPRKWEAPVSWNIQLTGDRLVPWRTLREAADMPIFRQCIEARKRALTSLDWAIRPTATSVEDAMRAGMSKSDAQEKLREDLEPEINRITAFWETPDPGEGLEFSDWLSLGAEEQLVLDATAIYPHYTYGGTLDGLEQIDGATIKPLLDDRGGKPRPPFPAYQQILWGFPRGEWVADLDDEDNIVNPVTSDELIYRRRTFRMRTPYGFSPTERALIDGRLYLARLEWMMAEYSDGVLPRGWLLNDGSNQWGPEQVEEYERDFNDSQAGKTAERFRMRFLPPGMHPEQIVGVAEQYKPDYDVHLISLLASHFHVNITGIGLVPPGMGIGSTGFVEGQETADFRRGTLPDARWWESLLTRLSRIHLAMPPQLEFGFLGLEEEDEADADGIADARVRSARMTVNEDRDRQGLPRFDIAEADRPMVITNRGVIPLEGAIAASQAAGGLPPEQSGDPGTMGDQGDQGDQGQQGDQGTQGDAGAQGTAAKGAGLSAVQETELKALRRWAAKGGTRRPFECRVLTADLVRAAAPGIDAGRITFKQADSDDDEGDEGGAAGGAAPKVRGNGLVGSVT